MKDVNKRNMFCLNCGEIYENVKDTICPKCNNEMELFDEESIKYIELLNSNGIITMYSCWGHTDEVGVYRDKNIPLVNNFSAGTLYIMMDYSSKYRESTNALMKNMLDIDERTYVKWATENNIISEGNGIYFNIEFNTVHLKSICTMRKTILAEVEVDDSKPVEYYKNKFIHLYRDRVEFLITSAIDAMKGSKLI